MSRKLYVDISLDDVEKQLQKYAWISSYEIYFQALTRMYSDSRTSRSGNSQTHIQKRKTSGISIRYITKSKHLGELSFGLSLIKKLADLQQPKSTQVIDPLAVFPDLKKPKLSAIEGDQFKTTKFRSGIAFNILEKVESYLNDEVLNSSKIGVELEKETIEIVNSHSDPITMLSLRTNLTYQYQTNIAGDDIFSSHTEYRRNLDFNIKNVIQNVSDSISTRFMNKVSIDPKDAVILLHPEVLGRIIAYQSSMFLYDPPVNNEIIWNENLHLYDDPLRDNGYQSCFIDDEGIETKPKTLIENGIHKKGLTTLSLSNWREGGNGFRNMWFQPVKHSFEYFIKRDATNLVLIGGTGKGQLFTNASGMTIVIKRGHGYIGGIATNPYFVIHAAETEVWKNGELLGPTKNYTLSGSLHEIMTHGDFSSDEYQVVDKAITSTIYLGWLRIPSDLVSFG